MQKAVKISACTTAVLVGSLATSIVSAEPAEISVTNETLYSTNAALREDKEADTRNRTTLDFYKVLSRTRLSGDIGFNLGYEYYFNDVFANDSDVVATMDVNSAYEFSPNFKWELRDTLNQVREDSTQVGTPDNRQLINVFETGPQWLIPLSGRTGLRLGSEYENLWFEDSDEQSNRITGSAALVTELATGHQLEGGVEADKAWIERLPTDINQTGVIETESESATLFGQVSQQYENARWSVRGGYTFVQTDSPSQETEFDGPTAELSYVYGGITTQGLIDARLSHSLSDTFSDQNVKTFDALDTRDRFDTIETTQFRLLGSYPLTAVDEFSAIGSVSIERYQTQDIEDERYTAELLYRRTFTPQVLGDLSFRRDQEEFSNSFREVVTYYLEASVEHRPLKNIRLEYAIGYTEREDEIIVTDAQGTPSFGLNGIEEVYFSFGVTWFRL
ncbi:hypothetical protein [Allohahella marinimesophila]|uniref:Beta-barrel porin 2 n=1 Tax=Allohahella marinimesophila TaxID=1054972 RepID=A0ABP7Q8C4_9GAMM